MAVPLTPAMSKYPENIIISNVYPTFPHGIARNESLFKSKSLKALLRQKQINFVKGVYNSYCALTFFTTLHLEKKKF